MDLASVQNDIERIVVSEEQLQSRLKEIAAQIERDYAGQDLLLIGVLKGAVMVMADLSRHINRHVEIDWMAVSSYGSGTKSSGVVRILKDLDRDITGRNVLIVEDIVDTGRSMAYLLEQLAAFHPKRVAIATLLFKKEAFSFNYPLDYVGFEIPNKFVVGFGLDYDGFGRNLPEIYQLSTP